MRRRTLKFAMLTTISLLLMPQDAFAVNPVNVYRFYNMRTGTHFYTASADEKANVQQTLSSVLSFEGVAYTLDAASPVATQALYRFYNMSNGTHFYTANDVERDHVIANFGSTYRYEGVAYMVSPAPAAGTTPVYRFYNFRVGGAHFYTASVAERDSVIADLGSIYRYEGVAYNVPLAPAAPVPVVPTGDLAVAQADLARYIQMYPLLRGSTVEMGDAAGYQAITYFSVGRTVISPSHAASIDVIMAHEIWHTIDWRDNGVIDWGENVPPVNSGSYVGRTQ